MGPAAWLAVGRALALAGGTSLFGGANSLPAVAARQVSRAVKRRDLDLARAMLLDLRQRHQEAFRAFLRQYGEELPPEFLAEFGRDG